MKVAFLIVAAASMSACATVTPSTYDTVAGEQKKIENSVTTSVEFDKVWDSVVSQISQSFFVINNIDKQSRIINVSFNTSSPETYVDCGQTKRAFEFQGQTEVFDYPIAGSNTFKSMSTWNNGALPAVYTIDRDTKLDGRANIYIAPSSDGAGSIVTANAIYVWSVQVSGSVVGYNAFGSPGLLNERIPQEPPFIINLTTKEPGSAGSPGEKITCASTGKFESSILDLVPR